MPESPILGLPDISEFELPSIGDVTDFLGLTEGAGIAGALADYTKMTIGGVRLIGWEIPEEIPFGGVQRVAVNQFLGSNKREVQILGAQPNQIAWEGRFYYDGALKRAKLFDQMRITGDPVELKWGEWKYLVVITEFIYTLHNIYQIRYNITLEVVKDLSDPLGIGAELGLLDSILAGIQEVMDFINDIADKIDEINSIVRGYVEKIRRVLKSVTGTARRLYSSVTRLGSSIIKAPQNVMTGITQDVNSLVHMTDNLISDLGISDPGATFLSSVFERPTNPTVGSIPVPATGNDPMIQLVGMNNAAKRLSDYLARLQRPPFVTTTKTIESNVFQVASEFYGDINAWEVIAETNGLTAPVNVGPRDLKLPPINGVLPKRKKVTGTIYETDLYQIPVAESGSKPRGIRYTKR